MIDLSGVEPELRLHQYPGITERDPPSSLNHPPLFVILITGKINI